MSVLIRKTLRMWIVGSASLMCIGCGTNEQRRETLAIVDADTGERLPARVHMRTQSGREIVPPDATVVPIGEHEKWFVSDGNIALAGLNETIYMRVERGLEYQPVVRHIEVEEGMTGDHTVELKRWIDMAQYGYVSGENHLHVDAATLGPMAVAEDLDFGTSLQWWNKPDFELPPETECIDHVSYHGTTIPSTLCDAEIEHGWGAVYILGLCDPIRKSWPGNMPNLPLVRQSHEAGALVCYQGGWSREVLVDALLGYVDVVNVCNNNFHRHQYQPRSVYSNLLAVDALPIYPDTVQGMIDMNTDTYYRLLNCGLQLAAGAGSATGPKNAPVGYNRAYVRAGEAPDVSGFLENWRAGRNFVTNGPMLFLVVGDSFRPGDTMNLPAGTTHVGIAAIAYSDQPLTSLEIVINGQVVADVEDLTVELDRRYAHLAKTLPISEGAWIAARCKSHDNLLSDQELERNHSYGGSMPRRPCRTRFAHTSPVYVTVGGQGVAVQKSIDEANMMLDAFVAFTNNHADEDYRARMLEAVEQAREQLRK